MKALSRKGKATPHRKVKRGSSHPAQQLQQVSNTSEQQTVERLQALLAEVDSMPLPTGQLGQEFLDCLKLTEKISEKIFARARELLKREPNAIPGWSCNETPQRVISRDTPAVFRTLAKSLEIDALDFLTACSVSLGSLRKLIAEHHAGMDASEVEFTLNRSLENLISYELVARLTRSKGRQHTLTLE